MERDGPRWMFQQREAETELICVFQHLQRGTKNWTLNLIPTIKLLEKLEVIFEDQVLQRFFAQSISKVNSFQVWSGGRLLGKQSWLLLSVLSRMSIRNKVLQYQHTSVNNDSVHSIRLIKSLILIFMFECYTQNAPRSPEVPVQKEKGGCVMLNLWQYWSREWSSRRIK